MQLASCQAYWEMYCACSNYKELVNKVPTVLKAAMMASLRIMSTLLTSSLYSLQAMHLAVSLAAAARVAMYVKAALHRTVVLELPVYSRLSCYLSFASPSKKCRC